MGSDNGLLPAWHKDINRVSADLLSIRPPGNEIQWNLNQYMIFILENVFENIVYKMSAFCSGHIYFESFTKTDLVSVDQTRSLY